MASERNQTNELTLLLAEILHILGLTDVVALSSRVRVVYLAVTHFSLHFFSSLACYLLAFANLISAAITPCRSYKTCAFN